MRSLLPDCYDQGQLGSCTGNSTAGAIEFVQRKLNLTVFTPSRLQLYYDGRALEGTVKQDSGCQIRDVVKQAANLGACPETEWPYDITQFAVKPPKQAYVDAAKDKVLTYEAVAQDINIMKAALAGGQCVIIGFTVYDSFESQQVAQTGVVPMPAASEQVLGGHAVLVVGYDDPSQRFLVRNSWGTQWGMDGYFTIPYDYLTNPNLADDFWALSLVGA